MLGTEGVGAAGCDGVGKWSRGGRSAEERCRQRREMLTGASDIVVDSFLDVLSGQSGGGDVQSVHDLGCKRISVCSFACPPFF